MLAPFPQGQGKASEPGRGDKTMMKKKFIICFSNDFGLLPSGEWPVGEPEGNGGTCLEMSSRSTGVLRTPGSHLCSALPAGSREKLDPWTIDAPVMRGARGVPWPGPKVTHLAPLPHSRRARCRKRRRASGQPNDWLRFGLAQRNHLTLTLHSLLTQPTTGVKQQVRRG